MAASDRLEPLRQAVGGDPENTGLRLVYAEALAGAGRLAEATVEYQELFMREALPASDLVTAGRIAVAAGAYAFASSLAAEARAHGATGAAAELRIALDQALEAAGAGQERDGRDDGWLDPGDGDTRTTFADIGGLAEMKGAIERLIVLPFRQPDVYRRFGRKAGGGLLLYGPPGCGKTLLARATAAECELPFLNVRIESILDPYFGVSERNLHDAFVRARASAPCVLFLDELNAIGTVRSRTRGGGTALVDQLLQELDGIGSDNDGILVLGATNVPWDVDDALKRPGRLDRSIFVPPPDRDAREAILDVFLRDRTATGVDVRRLAGRTQLFSGADLSALVERAIDSAIDDSLATGHERPLSNADFDMALRGFVPSTLEWMATARRYVEFANHAGRYDDVERFLRSRLGRLARHR